MSEETDGVDLTDALTDRDAAETIVRWIHDEYDLHETPETNQNYRVALRVFGRRATDEGVDGSDTPPSSIDWISSTLPNDYDPSPDPTAMLDWEDDVKPMIDAARNSRDAAAIALAFDAGLRGGELYDLTIDTISRTDHGLAVTVDGKTGQRTVDLIPSTPHVNRWLSDHPGGGDDPMWSKLNSPDKLSYRSYLDMFKDCAGRAGVEKDVTPTNFRKSNLAWLSKQGMNARYIERRQGRKHGSDAVSRYTAIFDADIGDEYARLMGIEVEDEDTTEELAPLVCPRCDRETPRDESRCVWCGQAMEAEASMEDTDNRLEIADMLAQVEGDSADRLTDLLDLFEKHPELRDVFAED
ncbi:integrase family protein [Halorubrum californiense DSM 19288]|uniref:Integrase family protein n=1 Tax=Halorubrum californiense DSM 19288 TaxID=1227465 RepID=M0E2Z6_9EURY|nr:MULTISPECIES: tyrosine-type recombinase/integrase [Halorubrum]ELZ42151.1 integrase family protein [Halorubrum californiense DSM 19288]TKX70912.1 site-specific integrase [Halorubrum sp. GN11GM_10-3_MGM]